MNPAVLPDRSRRLRLIIPALGFLAVVCAGWLASVFYFIDAARRAGDIRLTADRIHIQELEARRAEKDFMLRSLRDPAFLREKRSEYLLKHREEMSALKSEIQSLERLCPEKAKARYAFRQVEEYETGFQRLVDALHRQGRIRQDLEASWNEAVRVLGQEAEPISSLSLEPGPLSHQPDALDSTLGEEPGYGRSAAVALRRLRRAIEEKPDGDISGLSRHLERFEECLRDYGTLKEIIGTSEDAGLQGQLKKAIQSVEPAIREVMQEAVLADEAANRHLVRGLFAACAIMALLLSLAVLFGQTSRLRAKQLLVLTERLERDMIERQRAAAQLLQAERLAAIGQMVTGLAHESRNALQRSQACLDMLAHRVEDVPKALELVGRVQEAQDHLERLYEQVREYAAPVKIHKKPIVLGAVLEKAWDSLALKREGREARLLARNGSLDLSCEGDGFALEQVFRNILENALDACEGPPEISVAWTQLESNGRPCLRASVRDSGPGLTAEQRARIFEPFFTTKTRGTGLGMAIARRLVEAHGGQLELGPRREGGAEIVMTLPREERSA